MTAWLVGALVCVVLSAVLVRVSRSPVRRGEDGRLRTALQLPPGIETEEEAEAYRERLHPHLRAASYVLGIAGTAMCLWALWAEDPGDVAFAILGVGITVTVVIGMGAVRASTET